MEEMKHSLLFSTVLFFLLPYLTIFAIALALGKKCPLIRLLLSLLQLTVFVICIIITL